MQKVSAQPVATRLQSDYSYVSGVALNRKLLLRLSSPLPTLLQRVILGASSGYPPRRGFSF